MIAHVLLHGGGGFEVLRNLGIDLIPFAPDRALQEAAQRIEVFVEALGLLRLLARGRAAAAARALTST
ncbi:MAG TPA: hypothetical protein PLN53_08100, partial [Terricaulis sp.]|nr:hypothetical protein [Terricaulis sp.]